MIHPTKRYHDFDALRGVAMLLGIVLHGLLSFMFMPIWPAQDIHRNSEVYGILLHAIHGFRMPVFFLISGFFTAMMWRKRGARGLVVHRAKRLFLPLVIGTIVIWPVMIALGYWSSVEREKRNAQQTAISDIWTAAKEGDLDTLRRMIDEGANVSGRDSLQVSPLEWAAMHNQPEAIALLVENGAEVNGRNPEGSTPLHAAAFVGRTEAVRMLVELGADMGIRNQNGHTPLDAALIDMGIVKFIAAMLQIPIDRDAVVISRRETAAYLRALEEGDVQDAAGNARAGIYVDEEGRIGGPAVDRSVDQLWGLVRALYLGATFFPFFHHLWFLYYLLWLVGLFLVAVRVRSWVPLRTPSWMVTTPWCLGWLIPLTWLPQLFMTQTFGVDTAPGLLPWPPKLAYYAIFFGFGALCFGRPEFEEGAGRSWVFYFVAALPMLPIGIHLLATRGSDPTAQALISLCAVVYAWLMVFGMIGVFRRFFARENRRVRYLSDSAYWLYLAHLPLIIGLQIWVGNWDIHHFPKFLLVCTATFAILIIMYEYLVRYTFIGTLLNGKRTRLRMGRVRALPGAEVCG